ncbi:MAG: peptidoglycan-binding domain-containing protein [Raineya sp.]|nr:peptidoglycan-binding domain-containing protein [Raineya sp.]
MAKQKTSWQKFYEKNTGLVWVGGAVIGVSLLYLVYKYTGLKKVFAKKSLGKFDVATATSATATSATAQQTPVLPQSNAVSTGANVSGRFPLRYQSAPPYDFSQEVKNLQEALNKFYGEKLVADGKFGNATLQALRKHFPNLDTTEISESTYNLIMRGQSKQEVINQTLDRTWLDGLLRLQERDKKRLAELQKNPTANASEIRRLQEIMSQREKEIEAEKKKIGLAGLLEAIEFI